MFSLTFYLSSVFEFFLLISILYLRLHAFSPISSTDSPVALNKILPFVIKDIFLVLLFLSEYDLATLHILLISPSPPFPPVSLFLP